MRARPGQRDMGHTGAGRDMGHTLTVRRGRCSAAAASTRGSTGKRVVEVMAPDSSSPQDTFAASSFHEWSLGLAGRASGDNLPVSALEYSLVR
jgi:hypothetical protein